MAVSTGITKIARRPLGTDKDKMDKKLETAA